MPNVVSGISSRHITCVSWSVFFCWSNVETSRQSTPRFLANQYCLEQTHLCVVFQELFANQMCFLWYFIYSFPAGPGEEWQQGNNNTWTQQTMLPNTCHNQRNAPETNLGHTHTHKETMYLKGMSMRGTACAVCRGHRSQNRVNLWSGFFDWLNVGF